MHYNYDFAQLRYDMVYLDGPKKITTLLNFTSLWLNDTLYMYTWATPLSTAPQCVALDMGFGMMRPDWVRVAPLGALISHHGDWLMTRHGWGWSELLWWSPSLCTSPQCP